MKKALLVIDLQNDYFCGGKMELEGIEEALNKTNELISYSRSHEYEIFFIQHFSTREGATFFVPDTKGVGLHESLDFTNETIIKKYYPNSFRETRYKSIWKKPK
jgi:nicotinamidase-related amidase